MRWKLIEGTWRWPYRVSDQGEVQKQLPNGTWQTLKPYPYNGQFRVHLRTPDGDTKKVQIAKLVVDAFMGGTPPGKVRFHKNGMASDNAVENIIFLTKGEAAKVQRPGNSRPVVKVDRTGQVVEFYQSCAEAARKNHVSQSCMSKHCLGNVDDPYHLDGEHRYIYDYMGRKIYAET